MQNLWARDKILVSQAFLFPVVVHLQSEWPVTFVGGFDCMQMKCLGGELKRQNALAQNAASKLLELKCLLNQHTTSQVANWTANNGCCMEEEVFT